jgi:succinate dehydrogenase/fumarate reductase cytochrome b subunit
MFGYIPRMKRENFEAGIKRLFYAAWALWAVVWTCVGVSETFDRYSQFQRLPGAADLAAWLFGVLLLPLITMLAVRWIYRGFAPKSD